MKLPYKYLIEDRKIEFENSLGLLCEDAKNPIFPRLLNSFRLACRDAYEKLDNNKKYSLSISVEMDLLGTEIANSIEKIDFPLYDRCAFRRKSELGTNRISVVDLYRYESEKIMMMANELRPYPKIDPEINVFVTLKGGKQQRLQFRKAGPIQSGIGSSTIADFMYNLLESKLQDLDDEYNLAKGRKANATNID